MNSSTEPKQVPSEYQANLEMLMHVPIFAGLPLEPLKVLAYLCKREIFKPGEAVFHQHEIDANAYCIIEGKAVLVLENDEEQKLSRFVESDFIGGLSMFYDMKRLFTLKAETRLVCLTLSREKFQKTLEQFPEILGRVFEGIVKSIYQWESRFVGEHALKCSDCRQNIGVTLV
jgi:CRP/FNR family transcriptional regulator, cyclic AMP receptor protein